MNQNKIAAVELDGKDLPAHCPNPAMPLPFIRSIGIGGMLIPAVSVLAAITLLPSHPRVFLDFGHDGMAKCPYCGTEYRLKPGTVLAHH